MGGGGAIAVSDDSELLSTARTVVLLGKTGNGKSSTGNSLLGRKGFKSKSSSGSVTATCELQTTLLENRKEFLHVIDTPGLFDFSGGDCLGKEILKCIGMAKDGIHAVLFVLSVRSRFSREEEAAIKSLVELFGTKITDYMILVFTGGDELEENEDTLDDYLGRDCPKPLKELIGKCGHRCVLFDNKTKDVVQKQEQVERVFALVDDVMKYNGGNPYTNELFEMQKEVERLRVLEEDEANRAELEKQNRLIEDQYAKTIDEVERKFRYEIEKLEWERVKEHEARVKAEEAAKDRDVKYDAETRRMKDANDNLRGQLEKWRCTIM